MATISLKGIRFFQRRAAKVKAAVVEREDFVLLTNYGAVEGSLPVSVLETLPPEARHTNDGGMGRWLFALGTWTIGFAYGFSAIEMWTRLWLFAIIAGMLAGMLLAPVGWFTAHFWQPGPIWFLKVLRDGSIGAATYESRDREGVKLLSASYTFGIKDVLPIRKYFRGGGSFVQKVQIALMGMIVIGLVIGLILFAILTTKVNTAPVPITFDANGNPVYVQPGTAPAPTTNQGGK